MGPEGTPPLNVRERERSYSADKLNLFVLTVFKGAGSSNLRGKVEKHAPRVEWSRFRVNGVFCGTSPACFPARVVSSVTSDPWPGPVRDWLLPRVKVFHRNILARNNVNPPGGGVKSGLDLSVLSLLLQHLGKTLSGFHGNSI